MKKYVNGKIVEMTQEEIEEIEKENRKFQIIENTRPFTEAEINTMLIKAQINTIPADDNIALRMKEYYPEWETNIKYTVGFRVQHNRKLYKTLQEHTSQEGWQPDLVPSLWTEISETHSGTIEDPIPYNGNMALENGKYYIQDYGIYLCNRDTVNPVYNHLSELVGIYVLVV